MDIKEVLELHYITPVINVNSILEHGILSHRRSSRLNPQTVALKEVQDRRAQKSVPGGLPLHDYANLYFSARNPMMFLRRGLHEELCVIRVKREVLGLPNVVLSDGNASSDYTAFFPSPEGLAHLDGELVFAEYWTSPDTIDGWHRKRVRCAEVLVPHVIPPKYLDGAYVSCERSRDVLTQVSKGLVTTVNAHVFFR